MKKTVTTITFVTEGLAEQEFLEKLRRGLSDQKLSFEVMGGTGNGVYLRFDGTTTRPGAPKTTTTEKSAQVPESPKEETLESKMPSSKELREATFSNDGRIANSTRQPESNPNTSGASLFKKTMIAAIKQGILKEEK